MKLTDIEGYRLQIASVRHTAVESSANCVALIGGVVVTFFWHPASGLGPGLGAQAFGPLAFCFGLEGDPAAISDDAMGSDESADIDEHLLTLCELFIDIALIL